MIEKRADYKLIDAQPLNTPDCSKSFIKDQELKVDQNVYEDTLQKIAAAKESNNKNSNASETPVFDLEVEIAEHPDSLFIKCFAIKANETNDNGDFFSSEELTRATPSFVGVPLFTNHSNSDINEARGKVVHSWWNSEKDGIMIIGRVDAAAYPQLARGIKEEYVVGTSMGCFAPDCRVLMADGTYLPISDVQAGDFVYTHKGRTQEVLNTQIRYKNEFIKQISFEGYSSILEVTKNHPILTLKTQGTCACGCGELLPKYKKGSKRANNWKMQYHKRFINGHSQRVWNSNPNAKTHNIHDKKLMQSDRSFNDKDLIWKSSQDLIAGDVVLLPCPIVEKKTKDCSIAKAKLIGYFAAEGCFSRRNGELYSITFSFGLHEQNTYVKDVCQLIKRAFRDARPCVIPRKKGNVCLVVVRNPRIAKWFYKYCGEYSHKKKFHSEVIEWPKKYLKELMIGYINGDGCISTRRPDPRNGSISVSSDMATASPDLASQLHLILTKLGVYSRCYASQNQEFFEIKKAINLDVVEVKNTFPNQASTMKLRPSFWITIPQNFVQKLFPIKLHSTRNTSQLRFVNINNVYTKPSNLNDNTYSNSAENNYLVRRIKKIDNLFYDGPVYNLQVAKDNSYVVEDVAVKNCQVQYSLCSICHNYAETPDQYCNCIRERKTRQVTARNQECKYHEQGNENHCPICGSEKDKTKKYSVNSKVFEYNYGIKFIENSFVVSPACHDCGVTEVIDPHKFLAKVADIQAILPRLLKAASQEQVFCSDTQCIKTAGQSELDSLNQALDLLSSVSQSMLSQKEQLDLEFLSDLVTVLADLQTVVDELTEQGYGRLQSPTGGEEGDIQKPEGGPPSDEITRAVQPLNPTPGGGSKIQTGPAGQVGTVTSPGSMANRRLQLEKIAVQLVKGIEHQLVLPDLQLIKKTEPELTLPDLQLPGKKKENHIKLAHKLSKKSLDLLFLLKTKKQNSL